MQGNSLELLKTLEDNSVDAIVTDPPYGLSQHSQGDIVNAVTAWLAGEEYTHGKAGKADRDEGVNGMNTHNTVKPTQLMRYLVKLVTPQGGLVLDPFMGSGSTGKACMLEGMRFIGMELSEEYIKIAEARIKHAYNQVRLLHA
jgi:DNA modification methylase